jgi:phage tail sheath protein FI
MATYNRPGVFINELPLAAAPVNTAATATAAGAVIAAFAKGSDTITKVTSWYDFTQKFGGYNKEYPATFSVGSFFRNGGTELYVKRILPASAKKVAKATLTFTSTVVGSTSGTLCTFAAKNRGVNGNDLRVVVTPSKTIREAGYYDVRVYLEGVSPATSSDTTDDVLVEEFNGVVFHDALSGDYITTVLEFGSAYIKVLEGAVVEYNDEGVEITPRVTYTTAKNVEFIPSSAVLAFSGAPTTSLSLTYADYTGNTEYNPVAGTGTFNVADCAVLKEFEVLNQPLVFFLPDVVSTVKNNSVSKTATITNSARTGTLVTITTAATHGFLVGDVVTVAGTNGNPSIEGTWTITEVNAGAKTFKYNSTASGTITSAEDTGTAVVVPTGGWGVAKSVYQALLNWVETDDSSKRHFVVAETAADLTVDGALSASGDLDEVSRGAVYYPHLYIKDPIGRSGNAIRKIGPSGAVAGLFLATDRRVGPFKVAAGIEAQVVDAIAIERAFSPAELDRLNSGTTSTGSITGVNVVNAIRNLPGAGIVVMGGRTLLQDGTANRYINMRRSLSYIEKRLNDLASFAVFENNTETLWSRLTTVLGVFLNDYRNQGGLRGTTPDESFYIKCDDENNTATTIANGEVYVEIGVALEYPAEFVVINLSQKTAE